MINISSKVYAAASVAFLIITAYLLLSEKDGVSLALVAAALCVISSRVADFQSFDFGLTGVKAQMRATISEAQATIGELRELASVWAQVSTEEILGSGRWGGSSRQSQVDKIERIKALLTQLGVNDHSSLDDALYRFNHFDYAQDVFRACATGGFSENYNEVAGAYNAEYEGIGNEATALQLESLLTEGRILTADAKEVLEDFKHYEEHRTHRRPAVWFGNEG